MNRLFYFFTGLFIYLQVPAQPISSSQFRHTYREAMDSIIVHGGDQPSAKVLFAALYARVMDEFDLAVTKNQFKDTAFIMQLQQSFARRFLFAASGLSVPDTSWQVSFSDSNCTQSFPMPGLLLAINAHVNHDLLQSLLEMHRNGFSLHQHRCRKDYNQAFKVLTRVIKTVVNRYEHSLEIEQSYWDRFMFWMTKKKIRELLHKNRNRLYKRALQIEADSTKQVELVQEQEAIAKDYFQHITHPTGLMKMGFTMLEKRYGLNYNSFLTRVLLPENFEVVSH